MIPYYTYSQFLKDLYGEKVYKLPINLPLTCPNRDGNLGKGGCTFCSALGTGFESLSPEIDVVSQLNLTKNKISNKYGAKKFIAYFQNYTNTYLPLDQFEAYMKAACIEDVVEISVATRPDCLDDAYLEVLSKIKESKGIQITIELGLQTTNEATLKWINRGHDVATYIDAVKRAKHFDFMVCTHLILNLPGDTMKDVYDMVQLMNELDMDLVKLHSLYIAKGTLMAEQYEQGDFTLVSKDTYIERVIQFLIHLKPTCALARLVSRAPEEESLFCNWATSWWLIKESIEEKMLKDNLIQGKMYKD